MPIFSLIFLMLTFAFFSNNKKTLQRMTALQCILVNLVKLTFLNDERKTYSLEAVVLSVGHLNR